MRRAVLSLLLAVLASPVIASPGGEAPNLRWSDRPSESPDATFADVELRGPRVATTLAAPSFLGGPGIRVYDKTDGSLAWGYFSESFVPRDGLPAGIRGTLEEHLVGLATSNRAAFSVGVDPQVGEPGFRSRIITSRAFDLDDGRTLWSSLIDLLSDGPLRITTLVRFGPRLFLTGSLAGQPYVLVETTRNGAVLWSHHPDNPEGTASEGIDRAVFDTKRLYTAGTREPTDPQAPWPLVVRQYHAIKGRLRWQATYGDTGRTLPRGIAVAPLRLAVAGAWQADADGPSRWIVHSLSVFTGDRLWTDMPYPRATSAATAVDTSHEVVHVAGWIERHRRRLPVLRAYEAASGRLLWQRVGAGVREGAYAGVRRSFRPDVVVAAGTGRKRGEPGMRTLLQGFDATDGSLLWTRFGAAGDEGGAFLDMDQGAGLVAAGGGLTRTDGTSQPLLHLYELPR